MLCVLTCEERQQSVAAAHELCAHDNHSRTLNASVLEENISKRHGNLS